MIEVILSDRCNACGLCVKACPMNVLDQVFNGTPEIARREDCQSCFMCELYCKEDAIYVAPDCDRRVAVDERQLRASGLLGQFRRDSGWDEWADTHENKHHLMEQVFARAAVAQAAFKHAVDEGKT
ncbi:4Fe-4S dicluster domain-containing protein [Azomonas macrocytogenes]|uniref:NAD-dependent dihydropyrimidine dehydrogenase PreA subunit n=1 Tax=Azomonas macrocytogenes TaxID=69962 RepID=A0A839T2W9_AZOMA|nr:ferredoxin family protein [Azomonas macrocytogenes]MBB3102714.1 NAD-dependent dihydropyrimidine dehydrogenase PreA subunit [Azomonas macrocytogenes]